MAKTPTVIEAKWVKIGPELAYRLLESNTANRNIRERRVEQYSKDMKAGRWVENGDTIKFAKDGTLLDGQHRLWAVIEANREIEFLVVEGVDPSVMPTIDTGATRGFADVAAINNYPNSNVLAATLRLLYWYDRLREVNTSPRNAVISHTMLAEYLDQHPEVVETVRTVANMNKLKKIMSLSAAAMVYTLACRQDEKKAHEWLVAVAEGTNLDRTHPAHVLRERLFSLRDTRIRRVDGELAAALSMKSWMAYRDKQPLMQLRWNNSEDFPDIEQKYRARIRTQTQKEFADKAYPAMGYDLEQGREKIKDTRTGRFTSVPRNGKKVKA